MTDPLIVNMYFTCLTASPCPPSSPQYVTHVAGQTPAVTRQLDASRHRAEPESETSCKDNSCQGLGSEEPVREHVRGGAALTCSISDHGNCTRKTNTCFNFGCEAAFTRRIASDQPTVENPIQTPSSQ